MEGVEQISISSLTASDVSELMRRRESLLPVDVRGYLHLPKGRTTRVPVVIASMGSTGLASGREALYAAAITGMGWAFLVVDGFQSRGFAETLSDQGRLSQATSCADAMFALKRVALDDRIDVGRAAMLGYSRGGAAVLMVADRRLQSAVLGPDLGFAAHVALYPSVWPRWETPQPTAAPLLIIAGSKDDLAPLHRQKAYVEKLARSGGMVELIVVPDAHHSLDANYAAWRDPDNLNLCDSDVAIDDNGVTHDRFGGARADGDWPAFVKAVVASSGRRGATTGYGPQPQNVAVQPILGFLGRTLTSPRA